jgi:hypothetical protein
VGINYNKKMLKKNIWIRQSWETRHEKQQTETNCFGIEKTINERKEQ